MLDTLSTPGKTASSRELPILIRNLVKWWLFPGINLNARLRYRTIPPYLGRGDGRYRPLVLDAGCGNGALAYQAYRRGNRVIGVSIKSEIERNQALFTHWLGIPEDRLRFQTKNLYEIVSLGLEFDEIICTEVLEHIRGDEEVCRAFYQILKPGGTLHICCPNADHPFHKAYPLDRNEQGGHVRAGYTGATYQELLKPIGFEVSEPIGIGGELRHVCNEWIRGFQENWGVSFGVLAFLGLMPVVWLDRSEPKVPFSLYVQVRKPISPNNERRMPAADGRSGSLEPADKAAHTE